MKPKGVNDQNIFFNDLFSNEKLLTIISTIEEIMKFNKHKINDPKKYKMAK